MSLWACHHEAGVEEDLDLETVDPVSTEIRRHRLSSETSGPFGALIELENTQPRRNPVRQQADRFRAGLFCRSDARIAQRNVPCSRREDWPECVRIGDPTDLQTEFGRKQNRHC